MRSAVFYVVWLALLVVTLVVARARGFSDDGWDDDTLYEEDDEIIRETKWNPATPRTWICFTTAGSKPLTPLDVAVRLHTVDHG